jgi:hypothetical protein
MEARWVGALAASVVIVTVLRLIVRGRMSVRYASLWLVVSVAVGVLAFVPGLLDRVAELLGFAVPANLLFTAGLLLLALVTLHLGMAASTLERRTQRLAEEIALLTQERDGDGDR